MSRGNMLNFLDSAQAYIDCALHKPGSAPNRSVNLRRFLQRNILKRPSTAKPTHSGPIRQCRRLKSSSSKSSSSSSKGVATPAAVCPGAEVSGGSSSVSSAQLPNSGPIFSSAPTSNYTNSVTVKASGPVFASQPQPNPVPVLWDQPLMFSNCLHVAMPGDGVWTAPSQLLDYHNGTSLNVFPNGTESPGPTPRWGCSVSACFGADQQSWLTSHPTEITDGVSVVTHDGVSLGSEPGPGVCYTVALQKKRNDTIAQGRAADTDLAGLVLQPPHVYDSFDHSELTAPELEQLTTQSYIDEVGLNTDMNSDYRTPCPDISHTVGTRGHVETHSSICFGPLLDLDPSLCDPDDVTELSDFLDLSSSFAQDSGSGGLCEDTVGPLHHVDQLTNMDSPFTAGLVPSLNNNVTPLNNNVTPLNNNVTPLNNNSLHDLFMAESYSFTNAVLGFGAGSFGVQSINMSDTNPQDRSCYSGYVDCTSADLNPGEEEHDRQNDGNYCVQELFSALDDLLMMSTEKDVDHNDAAVKTNASYGMATHVSLGQSQLGQSQPETPPLHTQSTISEVSASSLSTYSLSMSSSLHTQAPLDSFSSLASFFTDYSALTTARDAETTSVVSQSERALPCIPPSESWLLRVQASSIPTEQSPEVHGGQVLQDTYRKMTTPEVVLVQPVTTERRSGSVSPTPLNLHSASDVLLTSAGVDVDCLVDFQKHGDENVSTCMGTADSGLPQEILSGLSFNHMYENSTPTDLNGDCTTPWGERDPGIHFVTSEGTQTVADCTDNFFCLDIGASESLKYDSTVDASSSLKASMGTCYTDRTDHRQHQQHVVDGFGIPVEISYPAVGNMYRNIHESQRDKEGYSKTADADALSDVEDCGSPELVHEENSEDEDVYEDTDWSESGYSGAYHSGQHDDSSEDESGMENLETGNSQTGSDDADDDEATPAPPVYKLPPFHMVFDKCQHAVNYHVAA